MLFVTFLLSLRIIEDLLEELGIDVSQETVRFWLHRVGPGFTYKIRKCRIEGMKLSHRI